MDGDTFLLVLSFLVTAYSYNLLPLVTALVKVTIYRISINDVMYDADVVVVNKRIKSCQYRSSFKDVRMTTNF